MHNVILWKWLEDVLQWFKDLLLYIPLKAFQLITEGLATLLEAIPVPDFMQNLGSFVSGLDPSIAYFLSPLHLGAGLAMVLSAYVIRFAIRRIPVIG